MILIKNSSEIEILKEAGIRAHAILGELKEMAREGTDLLDLDAHARKRAKELDSYPTFLGYQPEGATKPYPAAICASLNDVVVHGVPVDYLLKDGDILKIDMGITYKGLIADTATTVVIGSIAPKIKKLLSSTKRALEEAIRVSKIKKHLGDIGYAIERQARKDGFKVLKGLTGHGVGYELHEDPIILNFGKKGIGPELKEGMVLAIEPMFSLSSEDIVQNNDESYSSADRSATAHFEHTIAITKKGPLIIT